MKFPCSVVFLVTLLILVLLVDCNPNPGPQFRRLPFNGSIYGKRAASALPMDYDSSSKSLSSLCETVAEVCAASFPQQTEN